MKFWFCETCGKRLTEMEMVSGQACDKKLAGVYCTQCASGIMTMEIMPLSDDQARKILSNSNNNASTSQKGKAPKVSSIQIIPAPRLSKHDDASRLARPGAASFKARTSFAKVVMACALSGCLLLGGLLLIFPARDKVTSTASLGSALATPPHGQEYPGVAKSDQLPATQPRDKLVAISSLNGARSLHAKAETFARLEETPDAPVSRVLAGGTDTQAQNPISMPPSAREPVANPAAANSEIEDLKVQPKLAAAADASKEPAQSSAAAAQASKVSIAQSDPPKQPALAGRKLFETTFADRKLPEVWKIEGDASNRVADGSWRVNVKGSRLVGASLVTSKSFPLDRRYCLTFSCGSNGSDAGEVLHVGVFDATSTIINGNYRSEGVSARIAAGKLDLERRNVKKPWDQIPIVKAVSLPTRNEHWIEFEISSTNVSLKVDGINHFSGPHQGLAGIKEVKFMLLGQNDRTFKGDEIWFRAVCLEEFPAR